MNTQKKKPNEIIGTFALYPQDEAYEYIVKEYPWAEDYTYYYIYVMYALRNSIIPTLNTISEEDRQSYTPQKAYAYIKAYEMSRLSFITIIPTCNRPETIKFLLECAAPLYRRFAIDIVIYDSSSDNRTKEITKEMVKKGYFNVIYKRYEGTFDGFSLDHKIMQAYDEYADDYDYIWICRDGLVPVVDEILDRVRYYKRKKIDCIIVDTRSRTEGLEVEQYYSSLDDCCNLLMDQATRLQTLGMLIFSGKFARKLLKTQPVSDATYSLWQMAAPFHAFAAEPYHIVFCTKNVFSPNYYASTTHFWGKAEKALAQWAYRWYNVINSLPAVYDKAKKKCMMVYTVDFHPFTARALLEMRCYGGLTPTLLAKYDKYLLSVTKTPMWYIKTVAYLPKWLGRVVLWCDRKHPNLVHRIKNRIIRQK